MILGLLNLWDQPWIEDLDNMLSSEDSVELFDVQHWVKALLRLQLVQAVQQVEDRLLPYLVKLVLGREQLVVRNVGKDVALAKRKKIIAAGFVGIMFE